MVQNPHRQPDIHPGAEGGGSESPGALRDTGLATAPAGGDSTTSRHISHVISPRSLFETTQKRCNSNDADSTFELIAGELRATLIGGGRAWPTFETTRRRHTEARLLMLQNPHQTGGLALREVHGRAHRTSRAPPNGGNCTNRGATRRRHAEARLLMLQTPTMTPGVTLPHWRHAPSPVQGSPAEHR